MTFREGFVIAPGFHNYYMIVKCEGPWMPYRTQVFELGGSRHFNEPLDLGTIQLDKK